MDFAKKLLKKYGWNEGEGLGKNSDGITKPLKASLKFDTAGLGVDKAREFNNHWWERVFNDAAGNINVSKNGEIVNINVKDNNFVEISTKTYSVKKLKKRKGENEYKHFIKKSVLTGLKENSENPEDSEPEEPDLPKYKTLTDEELFAACDGRTAHKGARHGLKLTGKLSRIEQQERELLAKIKSKDTNLESNDWTVVSSKKKRKQKEPESELDAVSKDSNAQTDLYTSEYHIKSKKKKKINKKEDDELSFALNNALTNETNGELSKEKRKRKKDSDEVTSQNGDLENEIQKPAKKKKKSKDKRADIREDKPLIKEDFLKSNESENTSTINKKKKKKLKGLINSVKDDLENSLSLS